MHTVIQGYLGKVKLGRKQSYRNLAVFPLLSGYSTALDYTTLDEAVPHQGESLQRVIVTDEKESQA